jgi:acetyl esterase
MPFRAYGTLIRVTLFSLAGVGLSAPAGANDRDTYVPPEFEKPPTAIAGATKFIYKTGPGYALPLYVFAPPDSANPAGAVVFFHGSGWHSGTVVQFVAHARRLAAMGMVAAVAEYRVKVDYNATPWDGVADAKSAIRWLRQHAAKRGIDPQKIVAAGGSAGAHIALASAVLFDAFDDPREDPALSSRPDGVVLFAGVVDTTPLSPTEAPNPLFEGRALELSPVHHLQPGMPPVQIFQGSEDPWAPLSRVTTFADAMRANGDVCELLPFEGRSHFFYNHPAYYTKYPDFRPIRGENDFEASLFLMAHFLHRHGFLDQRPTFGASE